MFTSSVRTKLSLGQKERLSSLRDKARDIEQGLKEVREEILMIQLTCEHEMEIDLSRKPGYKKCGQCGYLRAVTD